MNRGSQVGQRYPVHLRQGNLDCRAGGQGFQILKNPPQQIMVLSAASPSNVRQNDAFVFSRALLRLAASFLLPYAPRTVRKRYIILIFRCQVFCYIFVVALIILLLYCIRRVECASPR